MMIKRNLFLSFACFVTAACAAGGVDENASGGSTVAAPTLMSLVRRGIRPVGSLLVLDNGLWEITSVDACRGTTGTLALADMEPLRDYPPHAAW
jgi:hypothetical protein